MGWLDWLCGDYKKRMQECFNERVLLTSMVAELSGKVKSRETEVLRLQSVCNELVAHREIAEADTVRFYEELMKAVRIPELGGLSSRVLVDPWSMTQAQWRGVRCELISDDGYYAFPEDDWLKILAPIQAEVKRVIGFPKSEVADCENFTLTMCDFVSLAFLKAGLDRQGAFLKLLSKSHSYCGFMMPDYTVKVYDPMSGKVIGWLGETDAGDYGANTYRTELAYFLA